MLHHNARQRFGSGTGLCEAQKPGFAQQNAPNPTEFDRFSPFCFYRRLAAFLAAHEKNSGR
jgi:hypothetical protein